MSKLFLIYLISVFYGTVSSWRLFFRGRGRNGNMRVPDTFITDGPEEQWFNQQLDHFNPTNLQQWKQRYFVNESFYDPTNGPVFLMIGGEAGAEQQEVSEGTWMRYAAKYNALCIFLEHRYYGKSHPVSDLSIKNLSFLSSEQALADIASFIVSYNKKLRQYSKWIVFGGSYAGSLAAWMRFKYPHLVHGAVSSSGPLLALADFKDYFEIVEEALSSHSQDCVHAIQEGTKQLSKLMKEEVGQQKLEVLFKLCDPIDLENKNDISNLYEALASNFAGIVQYNNDVRRHSKTFNINIDLVCNIMTNKSNGNEVERLAAINLLLLDRTCLDFKYEKMINELSYSDWSSPDSDGTRQWTYQTCTEFGFFQTSTLNTTKKLFGDWFPVRFFEKQCEDIFGKKFRINLLEEGIVRTNTIYGGLDIYVDNVVFVHGSIDPWHALGITKTLREKAPAIYINGTAHCADMYPSSPNDLPQLVSARDQIEKIVGTWLAD